MSRVFDKKSPEDLEEGDGRRPRGDGALFLAFYQLLV